MVFFCSFDYCVESNAAVIEVDPSAPLLVAPAGVLSMVFSNDKPAEVLPLQHCHGDCDEDTDCGEGLVCFERDDEEVAGCSGVAASKVDYCIKTEDVPKQIEAPASDSTADSTSSSTTAAIAKTSLAAVAALMFL